MSSNLTAAEFGKHLNTNYQVELDDQMSLDLELVEVSPHISTQAEQQGLERFSAVFQGPFQPRLPQRTYAFNHPAMGKFDLFIVPIAQNDRGLVYEAVFNFYR
jgi:hypothetical protein